MKMKKSIRSYTLMAIIGLVLASCSMPGASKNSLLPARSDLPATVTIELTVQANTSAPFNTVGQVIQFSYSVKNTGTASTPGPVTIVGAVCPEINTIGNRDANLDAGETLVCASSYPITQTDLNNGSVTNITTAIVNGISSNPVTTTIPVVRPVILTLTKTTDPATYNHIGQSITYTYVIKNTGSAASGAGQFTVSDTGFSAPINCGEANASLASNATVTCSVPYIVTQADMNAASISTSATASGGGAAPSQAVSAPVAKSPIASNLVTGSTISHQVVKGEWLWQIARCYGADPITVSAANTNPAEISPDTTVRVPNIGSVGKIYGPPCVESHTVKSGDTWNSIALRYNADLTVLQMVNKNTLAAGTVLKVPLNSAGISTTTGVSGNCVDLTRSLKLAGVNANATHFNLCGTLDSSGNMKIGTINIYQRPEDVGLGGLSQNITSVPLETSTAVNNTNSLIVGDMNYDGNDDFRIVKFLPAGPNIPYLYYLYDPGTRSFIYSKAYENITSPEFPGNSEIRSKWRESAAKSGIDTYTVANNTPRLTRRETWEALNATQATHLVTVFNADGTSQVTVNEVVALPIP
jgi:LysM repeat protein